MHLSGHVCSFFFPFFIIKYRYIVALNLLTAPLSSWELSTFYQFSSTLEALRLVDTPFVVKTRSDEAFGDLTPLMAACEASPRALISSNIYIRVAAQRKPPVDSSSIGSAGRGQGDLKIAPGPVSDHLFAGATASLRSACMLLVRIAYNSFPLFTKFVLIGVS